jgi:capsular polysaccharide phosphotransferase wcwK
MNNKIDLVITWVDGTDPDWLQEKRLYESDVEWSESNNANRYRPSENFKYWFRAVERYADWINRIFFITYGHVPEWLNTKNPKLKIVKHTDYIPQEYLPTYNSNVIELNLHRIEELSEHFILLNDDMYFAAPTTADDFFKENLPKDFGIYLPITPRESFNHIELNNTILMNKHFKKKRKPFSEWRKFYSLKLGKYLVGNIFSIFYSGILGYKNYHIGLSHLKSTFDLIWEKEPKLLEEVSSHRFRQLSDISHYVMSHWNVESGKFMPQSIHFGKYFDIWEVEEIQGAIQNEKYKIICINDTDEDGKFSEYDQKIHQSFQSKFPEKSSFEL